MNTLKRDLEGKPVNSAASDEGLAPKPNDEKAFDKETERASEEVVTQEAKEETDKDDSAVEPALEPHEPMECNSGIWLFTDRENPTHFFEPNFLPPYNTPEKRKIILEVLKEEWDEKTLIWKPCGHGSMTKPSEEVVQKSLADFFKFAPLSNKDGSANPLVEKFDDLVGEILAHIRVCCAPITTKMTGAKIEKTKEEVLEEEKVA